MLENPLTVTTTELRSPPFVLVLAVLGIVGVEHEDLQVDPHCYLLVLYGDWVGRDAEDGLEED